MPVTLLFLCLLFSSILLPSPPASPQRYIKAHHHTTYLKHLVWDIKPPPSSSDPINWVELKTAETPLSDRDIFKYERKLLKFWIQSFLLGVPKIIVGFRSKDGILESLEDLETEKVPRMVKQRGKGSWDGNVCINFTAAILECKFPPTPLSSIQRVWQSMGVVMDADS